MSQNKKKLVKSPVTQAFIPQTLSIYIPLVSDKKYKPSERFTEGSPFPAKRY